MNRERYEVRAVVCDYGVYEDGDLKLICNSRFNALLIKDIMAVDWSVPNHATTYKHEHYKRFLNQGKDQIDEKPRCQECICFSCHVSILCRCETCKSDTPIDSCSKYIDDGIKAERTNVPNNKKEYKAYVNGEPVDNQIDIYCFSWDGETYYGEYKSEEEVLKEARKENPEAEFVYVGTQTEPKFEWNCYEESIIESIANNLSDDVGEAAENFEVSTEQTLELAKLIDEAVEIWIEENNIKPSCFRVLDGHMVELN